MRQPDLTNWDLKTGGRGELVIGGCSSVELADFYGTPLHVVNEERLSKTAHSFLQEIKSQFPGKFSVHFAFKCNPVPGIIRIIKDSGLKAEVMSEFELSLALGLGFKGEDIIVNGPLKTDSLLATCLTNEVRFINIDSLAELDRLNRMCESREKNAGILLRVNPDYVPSGMNQGSATGSRKGSSLGLDLKGGEVHKAFSLLYKMKRLRFRGFHFHIGSGIRNTEDYRHAIHRLKNIVEYATASGYSVDVLDIGGGLGVSGSREMTTPELLMYQSFGYLASVRKERKDLSFKSFAEKVTQGIRYVFGKSGLPELILEPGRCIVSPNQILLLGIHQVKVRKGIGKWLIADAGIGTLTMPTFYEHHEIILCNEVIRKPAGKVTITGPGCFAADNVYRNRTMPEVSPGEIIAVMDSGAYFTSWESSFGFPRPAIVAVSEGRHRILRARETFTDMISLDKL